MDISEVNCDRAIERERAQLSNERTGVEDEEWSGVTGRGTDEDVAFMQSCHQYQCII